MSHHVDVTENWDFFVKEEKMQDIKDGRQKRSRKVPIVCWFE